MKQKAAVLWLVVLCAVLAYLALRAVEGIELQSNIVALLPHAERDATVQRAEDRVAAAFSRRVVLLVGDRDPAAAHEAGRTLAASLEESGLAARVTAIIDPQTQRRLGEAFFPYRAGLLSAHDRALLGEGKGETLVKRALTTVYGPGGIADGKLLARDPFLLLPSFFTDLPLPQSRLSPEDGMLTAHDGDMTYAFISVELAGDAYGSSFQQRFGGFLDDEIAALSAHWPDLRILRAGAIFYATEGTQQAISETSTIGIVSLVGTIALVLAVFRGVRPLLLSLLAIAVGILCGLAATLAIFGQPHAIALLFGVSLIGISVDYCFQYFCEYFDKEARSGQERLRRVLAGVALGLGTTLIGYAIFLAAPFPGLQQVATFSACGLAASFFTVALWYPPLDRGGPATHGTALVALAGRHWRFWQAPAWRWGRAAIGLACLALGIAGALALEIDDDVRHLQSVSPRLRAEEQLVQRLTGTAGGAQFLLLQGGDEEKLLETEETLAPRLDKAIADGMMTGYQSVAQFVPSTARQQADRTLVQERLYQPYLKSYLDEIGLEAAPDLAGGAPFLTLATLPREGPLALLGALIIEDGAHPVHLVLLQGVRDIEAMRRLIEAPGIRLISPAEDYSKLFGQYRRQAIGLLALSAVLMLPMLALRYGLVSALRVMAPSVAALLLAPAIAALFDVRFTFFNAMALVLILSIGVDYSVFCRETSGERKAVTMLAVSLAALSTILSFGLLALSRVFAVHAFGTTMLIGIALAFLLAPAAGDAETAGKKR
jgi:predicted exporter